MENEAERKLAAERAQNRSAIHSSLNLLLLISINFEPPKRTAPR